jgi:hypothetical protein
MVLIAFDSVGAFFSSYVIAKKEVVKLDLAS